MRVGIFAIAVAFLLGAGAVPAFAQTITTYRHLVLDGRALKWGEPIFGTGATVTYALVEKSTEFEGARNCSSMTPLDDLLSRNAISARRFARELREALRAWESVADISFSPADPTVADILIGANTKPLGYAFANVEFDKKEVGQGPRKISRSMICFNPLKPWKVGFDGDLNVYDLRYTLIHEIGHTIGLNHPKNKEQLMAYGYREKFRVLQAGDVRGIRLLYGRRGAASDIKVGEIR